jgi:hypothetical protein
MNERKGIYRNVRLTVPHYVAVGHILDILANDANNMVATVSESSPSDGQSRSAQLACRIRSPCQRSTSTLFWHANARKEAGNKRPRTLYAASSPIRKSRMKFTVLQLAVDRASQADAGAGSRSRRNFAGAKAVTAQPTGTFVRQTSSYKSMSVRYKLTQERSKMKKSLLSLFLGLLTLIVFVNEADARRLGGGGGRPIGRQSQSMRQAPPAPSQSQSFSPAPAPANSFSRSAPPQPAALPRQSSPMGGMLGGALLGLGAGSLLSHMGGSGMGMGTSQSGGGGLGTLLLFALVIGGVIFLVRRFRRSQ